ncbi:MAG TPA: chorismate mutase [Candidatus Avoscillospira avistercoris]|uniref:Bifunctional chorismate mutase/prephenate dehydratase n=1 Tax=Candidatus Avoscillospira avistercoris TaxID=2840707 RepID=A0A9D1JTC4_9FIRM|nr:chorismate mutase [Candidatus Avoscillospira avistercoris]
MRDLQQCRAEIDRLDRQIVALFEERMAVCREVGAYKVAHHLPVLDEERERQVLQAKAELLQDAGLRPQVIALFETIMAGSRSLQRRMVTETDPAKAGDLEAYQAMRHWSGQPLTEQRVLYQGQPGAYCEEAAMGFFGDDCQRMNLKTWDGVFRGVKEGFGDFGVVPIENSSTGSINDVFDLLGQFGCYIVGEQIVPVRHCLVALPDASMDTITDVYSHAQGFAQCRPFLGEHPKWEHHEMVNTAVAAKFVAESGDSTKAAIASRRAAELYGLQILQSAINENVRNYTRFLIVAAEPRFPEDANKISVRFIIPHREGSLCRILQIFAQAGLNLEKLESRPVPESRWEYSFYADFTGNIRREEMDRGIRELIDAASSFRVLGNYKAAQL